jgi:hypothetical protein
MKMRMMDMERRTMTKRASTFGARKATSGSGTIKRTKKRTSEGKGVSTILMCSTLPRCYLIAKK